MQLVLSVYWFTYKHLLEYLIMFVQKILKNKIIIECTIALAIETSLENFWSKFFHIFVAHTLHFPFNDFPIIGKFASLVAPQKASRQGHNHFFYLFCQTWLTAGKNISSPSSLGFSKNKFWGVKFLILLPLLHSNRTFLHETKQEDMVANSLIITSTQWKLLNYFQ